MVPVDSVDYSKRHNKGKEAGGWDAKDQCILAARLEVHTGVEQDVLFTYDGHYYLTSCLFLNHDIPCVLRQGKQVPHTLRIIEVKLDTRTKKNL